MYGLFGMALFGNGGRDVVGRVEQEGLFIDTCSVWDSIDPYETAVAHPAYANNRTIIVETYPNREQAEAGHERWVKIMTSDCLPEQLTDVGTNIAAELGRVFGLNMSYLNDEDLEE